MNGIEKITGKISRDADAEIEKLNEQTQAQVDGILAQARAQAEKITADMAARGRRAADERRERLKSAAGMERRKLELAAKQEVLGEAFDLAVEKLCTLPEEEYVALLTGLVLEASTTGREQVAFNAEDRERVGRRVIAAANEAMISKVVPELPESLTSSKVGVFLSKVVNNVTAQLAGTGLLTLAEESRNIKGGFIMIDGKVEINCAFGTLVRLQREKLERQVADVLFPL